MAAFYLQDNLTIDGVLYKKGTLAPLSSVKEKSLRGLVERGVIREIQTPPVYTLDALKKYATLLEKAGVQTLADFAFADLSLIPTRTKAAKEELERLQPKVKEMIKPGIPLNLEDCGCGESPSALPKNQE